MKPELTRRADALAAERVPFVLATVVRAQHPTSVRPGDSGIVLGDGTIEGFVGGACAESSVRLQALRVLETGEALLLRIVPEGDEAADAEGAMVVRNPCLSGGALEIFLEPRLPAPRIAVVGETPIGFALAAIGERLGYDVALSAGAPEDTAGDVALVVASHGREEEDALASALAAGVPYVGLVASRRRGAAVLEALRSRGVPGDRLARLRTPAGLDIGATTAEEIALSILAEVIESRREHITPPEPVSASAADPVCGMTVPVSDVTAHLEHDGRTVYFCGEGCRNAFEADPARYAAALG
jgi:xanthine dehydrogenase accessory factor